MSKMGDVMIDKLNNPLISIIIPVYNQIEMTKECIESIHKNTNNVNYEIVLIDNGSKPNYNIGDADHIIRNDENLGFPAAVNQGIKYAKGDIICLLNNDTIVTPNWLESMVKHLDEYAIVGCMTNMCSGIQRTTIPLYENEEELCKNVAEWSVKQPKEILETKWVIGFCMVFKKSLYEELGEFDESLYPCSGEEIDFCLRARQKGYKIGFAQNVYIHHYGSQTFKIMDVNYDKISYDNEKHLIKKWGRNCLYQNIEVSVNGAKLNLGCGLRKMEGYINIDNRSNINPDLCHDIVKDKLPYEDNSISEVYAHDFLEHIPIGKVVDVMNEIYRVLKPNGKFESFTPSTDGRGAFQDPTHYSFWNKNSWWYYSIPEYRRLYNMIPNYKINKCDDVYSDTENKIIHTHVICEAIK